MSGLIRPSRRNFIRATVAGTVGLPLLGSLGVEKTAAELTRSKSQVFRVNGCPVHDGQSRHVGINALLYLLSMKGTEFYKVR